MLAEKVKFSISDEVLALGVKGVYFNMDNIRNKYTDPEFEVFKKQTLEESLSQLSEEVIKENAVLKGYRDLHSAVGCSNRKNISSPESLISNFLRNKQLPAINLLVDIYNLISAKSFIAIGAHDLSEITGNVQLRLTKGNETFLPLGYKELKQVKAGSYAYIDESENILCYLETKQVEKTKVTPETTECFFIVQGNAETDWEYIEKVADELINTIKRFCGGQEYYLFPPAKQE